jgi:hypothetical protein
MASPDLRMKTDPDPYPTTRQKIKKKKKSARYY